MPDGVTLVECDVISDRRKQSSFREGETDLVGARRASVDNVYELGDERKDVPVNLPQ